MRGSRGEGEALDEGVARRLEVHWGAAVAWGVAVACAALLTAPGVVAQDSEAIDLERAAEFFSQARAIAEVDGGRLWGHSLDGPMLFADRATRRVVANRADPDGLLEPRGGVWTGVLPDTVGIANTATRFAGARWTMLVWPLPIHPYSRGRLLAHEMFHRIQPELGIEMASPANDHLDSQAGRVWLRLEMRALAEALIRRGDERRTALEDALSFRARRHAAFPEQATSESALERNEGLSEYTGFATGGWPAHVRADRAAVALESYDGRDSFARSFAYATGPAYAILLDEAGADWRPRAADVGLAELAAEAYAISSHESGTDRDAMARAARYDGPRLADEERSRAERQRARMAELTGTFVEGPRLRLPVGEAFGYTFDPNRVSPLPGVGSVFVGARVRDEWGILTTSEPGALLERSDGRVTGVVVPVDAASIGAAEGPGWTLELAEGWEVLPAGPGRWEVARMRDR